MAYFRCSTGSASSGDGVALVVTCGQDFAGAVITATNGTDTFTETCPSASPYTVRFEDIPVGTYTISGVAQGQTFTNQYIVLDYTTSLQIIPNGATVTPVNDIQIWLHCADIWDKSYTTIAQVLADASTLQALIASNNAADYMARSTSWASSVTANSTAMAYIGANNYCANKLLANSTWLNAICNSTYFESVLNVKVPTMTSNTTPSGTASASSTFGSGYEAYKAFDGNPSTFWAATSATNEYLQYDFTNPTCVKMIKLGTSSYANAQPRNVSLIASNDGFATSTTLKTWTEDMGVSQEKYIEIENNNYYLGYRGYKFVISATAGQNVNIATLQFYGRA